jgi:hypothetical protein
MNCRNHRAKRHQQPQQPPKHIGMKHMAMQNLRPQSREREHHTQKAGSMQPDTRFLQLRLKRRRLHQ